MANADPGTGQAPGADPGIGRSAAIGDDEQRWSQVAALGQAAQTAMRLGNASGCLATLVRQRTAAGDDQAAIVWALTTSSACRAVLGQLRQARADLAGAREACAETTIPLLAEPLWRFTELVCDWLAGNWARAAALAATLDASRVSPVTPAIGGSVAALRVEVLRGLGLPGECRSLAQRLAGGTPTEMAAWALAGLDVDQGRPVTAIRRLAEACGASTTKRMALGLALHRMAEIAYENGDRSVTARSAAALAELDQAAPLAAILTGLARAYASGDPAPARDAQARAEAEGAEALAAEALTVRSRIGDDPVATLPAALSAWQRIGATARAATVRGAMLAAGLPVPARDRAANGQRADADDRAAGAIGTDANGTGANGTGASRTDANGQGEEQLTARERALARLVHEGRTNRQIANELHISVKTVEACLTRVYRKTSCASRVELAVAVTQQRVHVGEETTTMGPIGQAGREADSSKERKA